MANSRKRCKFCREYFPAADMHVVPAGTFCTREHAEESVITRLNEKIAKKKAKEKAKNDEWKATLPKNKKELDRRSLTWQEDKTQTAFNKMRVQQELLWFYDRNIEPYCISCQKTKMDFCCGHNQTRGSNSFLQFDERNTFLQCNKACNSSLSGNIYGNGHSIGYLEGLKLRFGEDEGQAIIDYCKNSPTVEKRTVEEFEALRKSYNAEYRRLAEKVDRAKFLFESINN